MALTKIDDRGLKTPIDLLDNEKIRFGTGNDLEVYHDGTQSQITESGTGLLYINSNTTVIRNSAGNETQITAEANGSVGLYYDNSKKFETTNTGVNVTGVHVDDGATHDGDVSLNGASYNAWWDKSDSAFKFDDNAKIKVGTGGDLEIYHDGSNSYIVEGGTGNLFLRAQHLQIQGANGENMVYGNQDGSVELYHDAVKKFETTSGGTKTTGKSEIDGDVQWNGSDDSWGAYWDKSANSLGFKDSKKLTLGTGNDLEIYHSGTESWIKNTTGDLIIRNEADPGDVYIQTGGAELGIKAIKDGAVELYYNNVRTFQTGTNGITVSGPGDGVATIELFADEGDDNQDCWKMWSSLSGEFYLQNYSSGSWETNIKCIGNSGVHLFHDNTLTAFTTSEGLEIPSGKHLSIPNGTWTGDETGKIQTHSDHIYFQCSHDTNGGWQFRLPNGTNAASINYGGTYSTSDQRLKKDITTISNAVDTIKQLTGRSFTWINGDKKSFGLIAQEVEPIIPDVVITSGPDPANKYPDDPIRSVNYAALTGHLIEAIKELSTKIETLETKVAALEAA